MHKNVLPRNATRNLIGYYAAFVGLGLGSSVLGPTLPGLAERTGTDLGQISFLFTAGSLGMLLGSLLLGRLYDQRPGHPLIAAGLLVIAAAMALIPLSPWLWLLIVVMLVLGMAQGIVDVGSNALLLWTYRERVGPFMNGLHFFFGVGAFLSPIVVAQILLLSGGIVWTYWVLAALVLPAAFWLLRRPSPAGQRETENAPAGPVNYPLVALVALFLFLYVGAEVGFGGWVFTYTTALELGSAASAAYLTSAFWGALTLGRLLSIPLAARLAPRRVLSMALVGCLASVAAVLLWPRSAPVVWAGSLGLGLFMAPIYPTTISLAGQRMPISGRVAGWFTAGASVGGMTLPWLIGQLFEPVGARVTMWIILADLVVAVGIFVSLMLYTPRPSADLRDSSP